MRTTMGEGRVRSLMELLSEERVGNTLIVTPTADLRELAYQSLETGAGRVLSVFSDPVVKNVVVDSHRTEYFGSTALAFLVRLWKRVTERRGRMALCHLSAISKDWNASCRAT
jgi:anti-anti-sigma factor